MTNLTTEPASAQAEVARQLYQSWMTLVGADRWLDTMNRCNTNILEGCRSASDLAWQIPIRCIDDAAQVIRENNTPEPARTMALTAIEVGRTCLEAGQRCNALGAQASAAAPFNSQDPFEFCMQPAADAEKACRKVLDDAANFSQRLFQFWLSLAPVSMPGSSSRDPADSDIVNTGQNQETGSSQTQPRETKSRSRQRT